MNVTTKFWNLAITNIIPVGNINTIQPCCKELLQKFSKSQSWLQLTSFWAINRRRCTRNVGKKANYWTKGVCGAQFAHLRGSNVNYLQQNSYLSMLRCCLEYKKTDSCCWRRNLQHIDCVSGLSNKYLVNCGQLPTVWLWEDLVSLLSHVKI